MESLATRYRPHKFEDCVGQESIIKILSKQLELREFKNCYLFCGASGCGKTTTARIFANMINNNIGSPIEIDAASNNGVDNVRQIISDAKERALTGEYKIYIIDECHLLTIQSWSAFLKCIEEPPKYTIFIFCTTDPQKIPPTILNRCMKFNFNRIPSEVIKLRLKYICDQEGYINYEGTIDYISKISKGQMRDSIANLEKVASLNNDISINNALPILGNYSYEMMFYLINYIIDGNQANVINCIDYLYNDGADLKLFIDQFLTFNLDLMKYSIFNNCNILQIPDSMIEQLDKATKFENSSGYYGYVVDKLLELKNMLKTDSSPRNTCEVMLLQICRCR